MTSGYEDFITGIFKGLIALIFAIIGWVIKGMKHDIETVGERLHRIEVEVPKTYLSKDDFKHFEIRLFSTLERLENKLDHKVDKP